MSSKSALVQSLLFLTGRDRSLQEFPSYTSAPLPIALEATPSIFRNDDVVAAARDADAAGNCTIDGNRCHIPFPSGGPSKIGVLFYPGGLVDPRAYAPIASILTDRYGLPVVIPIFTNDVAWVGNCDSGRFDLAKAEFPLVEKWVLAGHSIGGTAAMLDMWQLWTANDKSAAGLVLISSYVLPNIPGCEGADFSKTNLPMASLVGTMDGIVRGEQFKSAQIYNSNATFSMDVFGANHGSFGAYDVSDRFDAIGQREEEATVPGTIVWDLTATSIAHVASRIGVPLPDVKKTPDVRGHDDYAVGQEGALSNLATATTFSWMSQWLVGLPWH